VSNDGSRLYPERPIVAALAVVRRGERVLLAQRSLPPGIGRWGFPGGMQELGETIEAGARRELMEETGIDAEPVSVLTAFNAIRRDEAARVRVHYTLVAVLLDWRAGEGTPIEDATEVGWFTLAEAEALETFPDALPVMRRVLAR
jgi:ADP-ribose pyrophosphatase YjhB (NUDIX family)